MYREYYGLHAEPFRLTPDPRFVYAHRSYRKAQAYMQHILEQGDGFLVVTGHSGTGKTTLVEDYLATIKPGNIRTAKLVSTQLGVEDMLRMIAYAFGLEAAGLDKATLLLEFEKFLRLQPRSLLIIDEAQNLSEAALEEVRMLTNLTYQSRPLLQIFLLGQQELRERLHKPSMEQLHQRLMAACDLEPLDLAETRHYVLHRLECAGWTGHPAISAAAFVLIHRFSGGLPRYISKLCARLFLHGAVERRQCLDIGDVVTVLQEIKGELLLPLFSSPKAPDKGKPLPGMQELVDANALPPSWMIYLTREEKAFLAEHPDDQHLPVDRPVAPELTVPADDEQPPVFSEGSTSEVEPPPPPPLVNGEVVSIRDAVAKLEGGEAQTRRPARNGVGILSYLGGYQRPLGVGVAALVLLVGLFKLDWREAGEAPPSPAREVAKVAEASSPPRSGGNYPVPQSDSSVLDVLNLPIRHLTKAAANQPQSVLAKTSETAGQGLDELKGSGQTGGDSSPGQVSGSSITVSVSATEPGSPPAPEETTAVTGVASAAKQEKDQSVPAELVAAIDGTSPPRESGTDAGGHGSGPVSGEGATDIHLSAVGEVDGDERTSSPPASLPKAVSKGVETQPREEMTANKVDAFDQPTPAATDNTKKSNFAALVDREERIRFEDLFESSDPVGQLAGTGWSPTETSAVSETVPGTATITEQVTVLGDDESINSSPLADDDLAGQIAGQAELLPVDEAHNQQVDQLLLLADQALKKDRLRFPERESAWHYYREVLAIDPGNQQANQGMRQITRRYGELALTQMEKEQYEKGLRFVARGLDIVPGEPHLLEMRQQLEERIAIKTAEMQAREAQALADAASRSTYVEPENPGFFGGIKALFAEGETNTPKEIFQAYDR
ncbi:MAG: AAA family ATPase [Gammaproteobacteria bacterium]|nr:AAA family ATPase [Gammaproteobacteria bacterium]